MRKNNFLFALKIIVVIAIMITCICIVFNLEVAQIVTNDGSLPLHQLEEKHPHSDISVIRVQYTTGGTMWKMEESTSKTEKGDALFFSLFDPRCLKDNKQFIIDFHYDFIVCTPKILSLFLSNKLKIVIPSKIYAKPRMPELKTDNNVQSFCVSDLNFIGKVKIFLRSFVVLFLGYLILHILKKIEHSGQGE